MTHPYAREDTDRVWPDDGPNRHEIRYGVRGLARNWLLGSAALAAWIPIYLQRDMGSWAFTALGGFWALMSAAMLWRRHRIRSRAPLLLTISDTGLQHWNTDGTRLDGFVWEDIRAVELEPGALKGTFLALKLTDEARRRLAWGAFTEKKSRRLDADYVIDLSAIDGSAEEVIEAVDRVMEGRHLADVRAARAELDAGDAGSTADSIAD